MEREENYVYTLSIERQPLGRHQFLACVRGLVNLPRLFVDYLFSSCIFDNRPRNLCAYKDFLVLNIIAAIVTSIGGILIFHLSTHALTSVMNKSAIFPLYLPHAFGLAMACKYQGSVALGNFLGFYVTRIYLMARGPFGITLRRALCILLIAALGDLETQIGAWLMHVYLCCAEGVRKKVPTIDNVRQAFCYIVIVLGTTLSFDTLIAVVACATEIVKWSSFLRFWATWWLGVVAAMLTISPAIIHMLAIKFPTTFVRTSYFSLFKSILLWTLLLALLILVFFFSVQSFVRPLPYLVFPLIIFASFRFNRVGWAIVVAVISLFCAWGTLHRNSSLYYMAGAPKDKASPSLILQIELFVSVMGLVGIVLAAAVKEKTQLTKDLNKVNEDLENTIALRTNELVKANQELRVSQQRAEHASHAKSDFLANMSHEIRTPIHGILGLTALLLESHLSSDQRESLLSVKECADLLLHIINSVLDLSKIEAGRLEVETVPFSIRKMVSSTLRMMQARATAHNLLLLWNIDGGVSDDVVGDPGKLQQCLLNLVGNALKFTNEGSVTVRVTLSGGKEHEALEKLESSKHHSMEEEKDTSPPLFARPPKPPSTLAKLRSWASWPGPYLKSESGKGASCTIDVYESTDDDSYHNMSSKKVAPVTEMEIYSQPSSPEMVYIEFEVQDTGIGISKEKLQDMFNPFTQADASTSRLYGGTGLGLCIVQRFVELLGGTIWAESEVNKGSTFGFKVPFRLTSDISGMYKPEHSQGPLRFSSLDAPVPPKLKTGLQRRAYSLDVLMRNMKFTLPSLTEGNDGEESVSRKGSIKTGGSLERTMNEEAVLKIDDNGIQTPKFSKEGLILLVSDDPSGPLGSLSSDQEPTDTRPASGIGVQKVMELTVGPTSAEEGSNDSHDKLPPSGSKDKSHKIQRSYEGHPRRRSGGEKRLKPPVQERISQNQEFSPVASDVKKDSTVINVEDRVEGMAEQQSGSPSFDTRISPTPSALPLPIESAPLVHKLIKTEPSKGSALRTSSGRGFKGNSASQDGEMPLQILLAEDNPINQKVASRQLQRHGHKVTIVGDGKQALEAVQSNHDLYDLVLMDVQMPNMDGLQATESIRNLEKQENWFRLPILGLTAHAIQGYQETCLSHGMDGYLGKPFEIKQLLKQMQELLSTNRGPNDHG